MTHQPQGQHPVPEAAWKPVAENLLIGDRRTFDQLPEAHQRALRSEALQHVEAALPALTADMQKRLGEALERLPRSYCCDDEHGPLMEEGESGEWLHVDEIRRLLATGHSFSLEEE